MITIKKILCPVDFFSQSDAALKYATALALSSGAALKLIHVVAPGASRLPQKADALNSATTEPEKQLKKRADAASAEGVVVESEVLTGEVDTEIGRAIAGYKPDLIAVGTQGRRGMERWIVGSTAERLMRQTTVPLLIIGGQNESQRGLPAVQRILVTTDFSDGAADALEYASSIARTHNAHVTLLHVVHLPTEFYFEHGVLSFKPIEAELSNVIPAELRNACDILPRVEKGTPWQVILRIAEKGQMDLLVMNIHGKGMLERALLGSTAERVVRAAQCPVLLIPLMPKGSGTAPPKPT